MQHAGVSSGVSYGQAGVAQHVWFHITGFGLRSFLIIILIIIITIILILIIIVILIILIILIILE